MEGMNAETGSDGDFEAVFFQGLLDLVFKKLYELSIRQGSFSPAFVNKRWNTIFEHPLQIFFTGRFKSILKEFPPTFYSLEPSYYRTLEGEEIEDDQPEGIWQHIYSSCGLTRQIMNLTPDSSPAQIYFVKSQLLHHHFRTDIECQETTVQSILTLLKSNKVILFNRSWMHRSKVLAEFVRRGEVELIKDAIQVDAWNFQMLPQEFVTKEMCELAIKVNEYLIPFVPKRFRTRELYEIMFSRADVSMRDVPKEDKTAEVCRMAVESDSSALSYIPKELMTREMCEMAVRRNIGCFRYVPKEMITEEMCREFLEKDPRGIFLVPASLASKFRKRQQEDDASNNTSIQTPEETMETCTTAVEHDADNLQNIPEDLKTEEMCEIALLRYGQSFEHVPEKFITPELLKKFIISSPLSIQDVPQHLLTNELCELAVRHSKPSQSAFEVIPVEFQTKELCQLAIKLGTIFTPFPAHLESKEMCEFWIENSKDIYCLESVFCEDFWTEKARRSALRRHQTFTNVQLYKTKEFASLAVQYYIASFRHVQDFSLQSLLQV